MEQDAELPSQPSRASSHNSRQPYGSLAAYGSSRTANCLRDPAMRIRSFASRNPQMSLTHVFGLYPTTVKTAQKKKRSDSTCTFCGVTE